MSENFHGNKHGKIVSKYKLVYIPIVISIISIGAMSLLSYNITKNMLIDQAKSNGLKLAEHVSKQINGDKNSLETMENMLEEKVKLISQVVISERDSLSEEKIEDLQKRFNVDEIHWIDSEGKTIYTTYEGYRDWVVPEGHPLDSFSKDSADFMIEEIRPDAKFGIPTKYGAMKDKEGSYVQVGIRAQNIENLTEEFSYKQTIADLGEEENIDYAYILDKNFKALAGSNSEEPEAVYERYEELEKGIMGESTLIELDNVEKDRGSKVLEIVYPIYQAGSVSELAVLGFSMDKAYASVNDMMSYFIVITALMVGFIMWIQNRNILMPANLLHENIHRVDLEENIEYRIPTFAKDTFQGISHSINHILDDATLYFKELEENKRELRESKEIISAAYQQLTASEEELRAQYDEIQDYTDRMEELKKKYEIAIECTNSAVWEIDVADETMYFSKEISNIIGRNVVKPENLQQIMSSIFGDDSSSRFIEEYNLYREGLKNEIYIQLAYEGEQEKKKLLFQGKGIYKGQELKSVSGILLDISKLKEQEDYIEYLAYNDFLTGLPNRRTFLKELESEISSGHKGAILLLDIDNFKEINDTIGHLYGDKVLRKISEKLMELNMNSAFISRFGGDEFLIMLPNENNEENISKYADRVIDVLKKEINISGESVFISCSMGITTYPDDGSDSGRLIMNADMAMYSVKNNGKSNYSFFRKDMLTKVQEKVEIEKQMRDAMENDGFKLLYQPQVDVKTGNVSGFEALLRMKDRPISPGLFIPIAEESDLIVDLGRYVTDEAIRQLSIWKNKGLSGKTMAINFSAKQLKDSGYIEFLGECLFKYGVSPEEVEVEVTESVFLEKKDNTLRFLEKLRSMGVRIALDDFGTGYSSFSYLTFLPVDKIKLDKSLSDRFLELDNIGVMDSLISLAHSLNLEVIAEGVEYKEQYSKLKVGKCDKIQGYLFSKPLEIEEAERIYHKNFLLKI